MAKVGFVERDRGDDQRCGTTTGYNRHQSAGEKPCPACVEAKSEYDRRWRSADEVTRRSRLRAKAQQRALKALKDENPDRYRALYLAAKKDLVSQQIRDATSP